MEKTEMITLRLFIGIFLYSVTESISDDCRLPGVLYQGTKSITETGRPCQRWDAQSPHEHGYDVFSIAKENYCRNFDREEPWCYTNDLDVRWELCGVNVCETPCLNRSFYTTEIKSQCVSDIPRDSEYCSNILNMVSCLKKNIEYLTGSNCLQITWRSIALQIRGTLEDFTGKSISQCIFSHCRDLSLIDSSSNLINFARPCLKTDITNAKSIDLPTFCRFFQRFGHCVVSNMQDRDKTNSTCLVGDKLIISNSILSLIPANYTEIVSFCFKYLYSEFSAPLENITDPNNIYQDTTLSAESMETNTQITNFSQTAIFLAVGFAVVLIFAASFAIIVYKIRKITMRKRRKELMRLPSIPKSKDSPYEMRLTNLESPYSDPDYEIMEEQDERYEHLPEPGETTLTLTDEDGPYIDSNNADGTYLDVVNSVNGPNDYVNVSPYIDLLDDTIDDDLKSEAVDILQSENAAAKNVTEKIDVDKKKEINEDFPP
ncbi:uncharacterized protein LOC134256763 isoform X2 [Saccostrea cucullata]|uniref:uncharacterized protein LOC134256763 isoform X2 n=1 Tax=Saccostrea cuccullata TaxID=36930 RepID=UPI002ED63645